MHKIIIIALTVFVLGLTIDSIWYVPSRISRLLGGSRAWPRYIAMAVILTSWVLPFTRFIKTTSTAFDLAVTAARPFLGVHIFLSLLMKHSEKPYPSRSFLC